MNDNFCNSNKDTGISQLARLLLEILRKLMSYKSVSDNRTYQEYNCNRLKHNYIVERL